MKCRTVATAFAVVLTSANLGAQTTTPAPVAPAAVPLAAPVASFSQSVRPSEFQRNLFFARSSTLLFANSKRYFENYQRVQDYGRCVARVGPTLAQHVLDASPNTVNERQSLDRLGGVARACVPSGYVASVVLLRGGLAEALYRRAPTTATLHVGGTTAAQVAAFQAAEADRGSARLIDDRVFTALANCLAIHAPSPVNALLLSRHGSGAERAAVDAVLAGAPACVGTSRYPTGGARSFLRAYLAESAYRWAEFTATGAAVPRG